MYAVLKGTISSLRTSVMCIYWHRLQFSPAFYQSKAMTLKIRTILFSFALILSAGAVQAQAVHEYTLNNGMKLLIKEDKRAPTVVHMVWYRVGSIDETNGTTGISHVLEHMMFKGTKKYKPGEFSRIVAALGGRENAFTSRDYTGYYQQVEKSRLDAVMALEADRMQNVQFSQAEFEKEIQVVMEERRWRTDDQPMGMLMEALNAAAFMAHPYHHPIVGWMSDLESMTLANVENWYRSWYAPNNATLVVVGDVDAQHVRALAEKLYGGYKRKTLPVLKPQTEPVQNGIRRVTVKAPAENPYVMLAFKVPNLRDLNKDTEPYALSVLAAVLDGYENARLTKKLVRTDRVALSADASYDDLQRGPSLFMLGGSPVEGTDIATLERLLRAEVERIAKEGVSDAELQRVKRQLIASQVYKRDSMYGQAMELGYLAMEGVSYQQIDLMLDKLKAVTSDEVKAVAARYFNDDGLTVAHLVPLPLSDKAPAPLAAPGGLMH
jgi:zinc protease